MKTSYTRSRRLLPAQLLAAVLISQIPQEILAQASATEQPAAAPAPASPTAPTPAADEELIELSPFTITADSSNSYTALNTTSVTRFRAELAKLPVSADVFTETFLDDVAATSIDQLIVDYGTGTGIGGNDAAGEADRSRAGDRGGNITVKIRGLDAGETRINSFGAGSINDAFNTERVDLIRGPQSLLNGGVGAGGVVNVTTKQARFNSSLRRLTYRIDDNGSDRAILDYGHGSRNIAIRTALMSESLRYSRVGLMRRAQAGYVQMAFAVTPNLTLRVEATHLFRKNSDARRDPELGEPSVTANAPQGVVQANAGPNNNVDLRVLLATGQLNNLYGGALRWVNWDNVDSLYTGYLGNETTAARYEGTLEYKTGTWGAVQLAAVYDRSVAENATLGGATDLNAPNRTTEGTGSARRYILPGEFVVGFRPESNIDFWARKGVRANMAIEFDLLNGKAKNQFLVGAQYETTHNNRISQRYFEVDPATGNIIASGGAPEDLYRIQLPTQYFAVNGAPIALPFGRLANEIRTADGKLYRRANFGFPGGQPRTPENPLGWAGNGQLGPNGATQGGTGGFWDQYSYNDSYYIAGSTDWFDGLFSTLAGYRLGNVENKRFQQNHPGGKKRGNSTTTRSLNLGINYRLTNTIRPYYGYSNAYLPPSVLQFGPDGEVALSAESEGHEFGIKFDPKDSKYSGSLAYYMTESENEQGRTSLRGLINPGSSGTSSLNGEATPTDNWINLGRKSEGVELRLIANPTKNWRSVLSAAMTDGKVGETRKYPVRYNDQFYTRTDGVLGQVVQRVSIDDPNLRVDMNTGNTFGAPRPLTVDLMKQPMVLNDSNQLVTNPFYYNPDPTNPGFTNSTGRNLLTRYYDSNGASESTTANATSRYRASTGVNGLPFSANQFGLPPDRAITVGVEGEPTSGYAKYSATWTNNYDFTSGPLNGFSVGGTVFYKAENRQYMYTFTDANGNEARQMFFTPDTLLFDLVLKYTKRFGKRYTWTSQINIANVFDDYDVQLLPNEANGRLERARYTNEPRTWAWTNTFSF